MAPTPSSGRRALAHKDVTPVLNESPLEQNAQESAFKPIFLDLMMGTALQIFVEKDVDDRENIVQRVQQHGGNVATGYSGVPYILVDPHKESGQNLYRQYAGKKGKLVLDVRWVNECINAGAVQTFANNWAGCKVTGNEEVTSVAPAPILNISQEAPSTNQNIPSSQPSVDAEPAANTISIAPDPGALSDHRERPETPSQQTVQSQSDAIAAAHNSFQYDQTVYPPHMHLGPRPLHLPPSGSPQTWPAPASIMPGRLAPPLVSHPPMVTRPMPGHPSAPYRHDVWTAYYPHAYQNMLGGPSHAPYDQRYRDEQTGWMATEYPEHQYGPPYPPPPESFLAPPPGEPSPTDVEQQPEAGPSASPEKLRGRKRMRTAAPPAPPTSSLVIAKRNSDARSPTPPTRVVKSTYGGNLFTPEDIEYLQKYITYCQEQGMVLSLREICERIAVRAPHHTFYSWRRYCNKHQIRLGGYSMARDRSDSPADLGEQEASSTVNVEIEEVGHISPAEQSDPLALPEPPRNLAEVLASGDLSALEKHLSANPPPPATSSLPPSMVTSPMPGSSLPQAAFPPPPIAPLVADAVPVPVPAPSRNRSPTPPRALFRSTTGKGVAFTQEDVQFLVRFLEYRRSQGKLDMVVFWKDVAAKAPHHSRASWMKYYRRHKHELHRTEGDEPLPQAPEKKMRYSRTDDILLARFFQTKPEGTSDKLFQAFARQHPHHPWKGWQEHHRIHKTQIDHLIQRLDKGEVIDDLPIIEAKQQAAV